MGYLPESLDYILNKIINMAIFVVLLFIDNIFASEIINYWKHYFKIKVKSYMNEKCLKCEIKDFVLFDLRCVLLSWCPMDSFRPDLIVTVFGEVDPEINVCVQWDTTPPFSSGHTLFGRVTGAFTSEELALSAAKKLSALTKSVITFQLNRIIDIVLDAELCHPLLGKEPARIQVLSKGHLTGRRNKRKVKDLLDSCGNVTYINFHNKSPDVQDLLSVICEATYEYAYQAYVAKFTMDGLFFKPILASFSIKVQETEKERYIARMLRWRLMELLDENRVVRV